MRRARLATRRGRLLGALLAVAALSPASAPARELWSRGDASLDFSGSLRELLVGTHGTDLSDFADAAAAGGATCAFAASFPSCPGFDTLGDTAVVTSLTRLRTRLDLRVNEHVSAALAYDHELLAGRLDTFEGALGGGLATGTLLDAEWNLVTGERARWRHLLYRAYLFLETEHVEAVAGRQRIPWGVGRLWNPIDRFNAIPPLALEADQSPGVDALLVRWLFSGFTSLEAVFAPQDAIADSAYALRLHGVLRDVDYSLMAGVFEGAPTAGFDLAGNLGDAAARLELVFTHPEREVREIGRPRPSPVDPFFEVVVSIDYVFGLGSGVYALLEHFYNGNALGFGKGRAGVLLPFFEETGPEAAGLVTPTSADRFAGSRLVTAAENQTGLQLGYDLTPELRGELLSLYDWDGASASFFPLLRWTPLDWLEVSVGGQLFVGPRRSQYGDAEHLGFLLAEVFF